MLGALLAAGRVAASIGARVAPAIGRVIGRVAPAITKVAPAIRRVAPKVGSIARKIISTGRRVVTHISRRVGGFTSKARTMIGRAISRISKNPVVKAASAALAVPIGMVRRAWHKISNTFKPAIKRIGGWVKHNKTAAALTAGLGAAGAAYIMHKRLTHKASHQRNTPSAQDKADKVGYLYDGALRRAAAEGKKGAAKEAVSMVDEATDKTPSFFDQIAGAIAGIPGAVMGAIAGIPGAVMGAVGKAGEEVKKAAGGILGFLNQIIQPIVLVALIMMMFKFIVPMVRRIH